MEKSDTKHERLLHLVFIYISDLTYPHSQSRSKILPNSSPDCIISGSDMTPSVITKGRCTYVHDVKKGPPEAIDVHHIIAARKGVGCLMFCTYSLLFAITCFLVLQLLQDKPLTSVLWSFALAAFLLRQFLRKRVEKESVIILPAFGVQLETVYRSGKIVRDFVPIGKILKPVLNECVTPVTCYWSLSLILRGEEELLLVFKELYPPVTMLVPIWKALCAAIDDKCSEMHTDCDTR
ncbi:GPI-GlcNAc transferase complex, PIG-H component [Handroanthus impetiginosus]|uniref:GPI-GlcNAc transferase complex, PIG-H component n=1 Tax=Handroanthus impetiginosus TaxID=429701 RepID=A0A2G9HE51_9LAMI|nr:GPI-GlcNAc transferase complex, PIG-H component [Handroanthus impetiginosus]